MSTDAALFTEMVQVGGEAVADVDHGCGDTMLSQILPDGQTGLRVEVRGMPFRIEFLFRLGKKRFEGERRGSKLSGDVDRVARLSA